MDQPYLHNSLQPFIWWIRSQAYTFQLQRSSKVCGLKEDHKLPNVAKKKSAGSRTECSKGATHPFLSN